MTMPIYTNTKGIVSQIKEKPFKLEKEIQHLFEANLNTIMGLELVRSEFAIKNNRIDTLAFDPQSNAFIIIEYKRSKNISVVDQGFTYLGLMLENQADFIIEYNETLKKQLKRTEVDWSQSRVVFVSTNFTDFQKSAANFKDIAIELWEVKRFENDTISIVPINKSRSAASIQPITQANKALQAVQNKIKVYDEDYHFVNRNDAIIELYEKFRNGIMSLSGNMEIVPRKKRINFRNEVIICDIALQSGGLKMWINKKKGELYDPKGIARDVSRIGHWGNGDYEIVIKDDSQLEYILSLIKETM